MNKILQSEINYQWKAERYPRIIDMASQFDIPPRSAVWMRMRYLNDRIKTNENMIPNVENLIIPLVTLEYYDIITEKLTAENEKMQRAIQSLKDAERGIERRGAITDDMVARAKDYPITELIDFDRTGSAVAFCHPDQKPSLKLWKGKNKASCFPCDKKFDPIDILMVRDGLSFQDAVRRLGG